MRLTESIVNKTNNFINNIDKFQKLIKDNKVMIS